MKDDPSNRFGTPAAVIEQLIAARRRGDLDRAVACYEPDAKIVAQPGQIVSGHEATRAFVAASARLALVFTNRSIVEGDGVALHQAAWHATQLDGSSLSGCTADVLRQQTDGSWRLAIDNPWGSAIVEVHQPRNQPRR